MDSAVKKPFAKKFSISDSPTKLFASILVLSLVAGIATGFFLASSGSSKTSGSNLIAITNQAKTAQQDNKTFRDFAEGKIVKKPDPKPGEDYTEGTHLLIRVNAVPVALTSSVVDLSQYEGKNVKVLGETQKAIKEGWLMDVGKVEEK